MDHRPKKKFGQNFLIDTHVIGRILAAAELSPEDRVVEIGPGLGALTDRMLPAVDEVSVMELDRDLVRLLEERQAENLAIFPGDALRLPWEELLPSPPYKMVANLPYNISSQVLFRILEHRHLFGRLVLMFQKEVGDRLLAAPGSKEYGILSVLLQLWYDIRRVVRVPPGAFRPVPKVASVVLAFDPLSRSRVEVDDEPFFRRVVKGAFAQRRKTLRNALVGAGFPPEGLDRALEVLGIDPRRRGETLRLEEFASLAAALRTATR